MASSLDPALVAAAVAENVKQDFYHAYIEQVVLKETPCNLQKILMDTPTTTGRMLNLLAGYLTAVDSTVQALQAKPEYDTDPAEQQGVSHILLEASLCFEFPPSIEKITKTRMFNEYIHQQHFNIFELQQIFSEAATIHEEFTLVKNKRHKRRHSKADNTIPTKNKYEHLANQADNMDTTVSDTDNSSQTDSNDNTNAKNNTKSNANTQEGTNKPNAEKNKIHPFIVEVDTNWTILAKATTELCKDKPLVKMDGQHLKIHTKTDDDFRKVQNYLDENIIAYTTLSPKELRPRKVCIRGIPCHTTPQVIIDALKEKGFIATRAAMLKNRKTQAPMPIYLLNVTPRENFDAIFDITELCCLTVAVERFRGSGIVKQCYRCQAFNHASEICKFAPKCVKCAGPHLTLDCPHKDRINPTCANCQGPHPASYRGCPKNPQNNRKKSNTTPGNNNRNTPRIYANVIFRLYLHALAP